MMLLIAAFAAVFVVDFFTPLGYAVWLGYPALTLTAQWIEDRRLPWILAITGTGLIALGFLFSSPGIPTQVSLVNRSLGIALLWMIAAWVTADYRRKAYTDSQSPRSLQMTIVSTILAPTLGLASVSALLFWQLTRMVETNELVAQADAVLTESEHTLKLLLDMETGLRGLALSGDIQFFEPFHRASVEMEGQFNLLSALVKGDSEQGQRAQDLRTGFLEWRAYADAIIKSVSFPPVPLALAPSLMEGKIRMDAMQLIMSAFIDAEREVRDDRNMTAASQARYFQGELLSAFLLLTTGVGLVVSGRISKISTTYATALQMKDRSEQELRLFTHQLEQRVDERTRDLLVSGERLRSLAMELNVAEQRERKRLAVELHDHLQQLLVLSRLKLGQGKRLAQPIPACANIITQADEVLAEALAYTRTLVAELSPVVLHEHGLAAGLKWLAAFMRRYELDVTIEAEERGDVVMSESHSILVFQSVRELLFNTIKHAGSRRASLTLKYRDRMVQVEVQDEGKGFDMAKAQEGAAAESSKFGLFSIQERMRALHGTFTLHSVPGQGTTATLTLPIEEPVVLPRPQAGEEAADDASALTVAGPEGKSSRITVLLVDDHTMVRQGLRSILEGYPDIEVIAEASDGEEAVQLVQKRRPAIVLMDINMPKMNGIEATAKIRACYPDIQVIGLSVNAGADNQGAMTKAGAALLLTKEAAVDEIHRAIKLALKRARTADSVVAS